MSGMSGDARGSAPRSTGSVALKVAATLAALCLAGALLGFTARLVWPRPVAPIPRRAAE